MTHWVRVMAIAAGLMIAATSGAQVPGSLDTTFAAPNGKITAFGLASSLTAANAVALQSDGKIVVAGTCNSPASSLADFCVARLNANGTFDTGFVGPPGAMPGGGKFSLQVGPAQNDRINAVALQANGKILLAGTCSNGSDDDFCVARLNVDGTYDTSFDGPAGNGDGKFILPVGTGNDRARALAVQPDGRILIAGSCFGVSTNDACVVRLNADGTFDTSFDGPSGNGNGKLLLPIGASASAFSALTLQPDGKIVLLGDCVGGNADFCLARLNADGSYDSTFDGPGGTGDGRFALPIGTSFETSSAIALQPDGRIVVAGYCANATDYDFCAARLNTDGSLDTSFVGPAGTGNGRFLVGVGTLDDVLTAMAVQPDGKIVLTGYCRVSLNVEFCQVRLNNDGSLDTLFDGPGGSGNGKFILSIGPGDDHAQAMVLQPDGKIVQAGYCRDSGVEDFCIARFNGGPFGKQCSLDIDGDGVISSSIDALIITRAALGVQGAAIIGGIGAFPANAKRTTWPQIRDYLVLQCGMSLQP